MNIGKTLFAQLMDFLPWKTFHRIVDRRDGDRYVKAMTCADQFRVMAFARLTYRESLRDIEVSLSAQVEGKLGRGAAQTKTELKARAHGILRSLQQRPQLVRSFFHAPSCAYAAA